MQPHRRQLHSHHRAVVDLQPLFHRDVAHMILAEAQGQIGLLQRRIGFGIGRVDPALHIRRLVDELHHLPDENIALAIHQIVAQFCQLQTFLRRHEIALGGRYLCHSESLLSDFYTHRSRNGTSGNRPSEQHRRTGPRRPDVMPFLRAHRNTDPAAYRRYDPADCGAAAAAAPSRHPMSPASCDR